MEITVHIPDDLVSRLSSAGGIGRRLVEGLALEEFRNGHLTRHELRQLLGFETSIELDEFLVRHGIFGTYTEADLARDRQDLERLGY